MVTECGRQQSKVNTLLLQCCALRKFHMTDGQNTCDQITSDTGLQITAGQRTMSGLIADLTGQTPVLPVILTGHFWIQTLYFPCGCRLMLYNAAMISFFFGVFCCFALNPSKKKNAAIN